MSEVCLPCFWSSWGRYLGDREALVDGEPARYRSGGAAKAWAADLLQQSRRRGLGTYPSWAWIREDPDLKPLEGTLAFDELYRWLEEGKQWLDEVRNPSTPPEPTENGAGDSNGDRWSFELLAVRPQRPPDRSS